MTSLANSSSGTCAPSPAAPMRRRRFTRKLPVPVQGSRIVTPLSDRDVPNSGCRSSSTLSHMKSTMGCGV